MGRQWFHVKHPPASVRPPAPVGSGSPAPPPGTTSPLSAIAPSRAARGALVGAQVVGSPPAPLTDSSQPAPRRRRPSAGFSMIFPCHTAASHEHHRGHTALARAPTVPVAAPAGSRGSDPLVVAPHRVESRSPRRPGGFSIRVRQEVRPSQGFLDGERATGCGEADPPWQGGTTKAQPLLRQGRGRRWWRHLAVGAPQRLLDGARVPGDRPVQARPGTPSRAVAAATTGGGNVASASAPCIRNRSSGGPTSFPSRNRRTGSPPLVPP